MPTTGLLAVLLAMATVDVPFGDHGIAVTMPDWPSSEVRLQHFEQDTRNLDLTIFTQNLMNRADPAEGIMLRFSPKIETFEDFIGDRRSIMRRIETSPQDTIYRTWSFDDENVDNPFDIAPLLRRLGLQPELKHEFLLKTGAWHTYEAYFDTSRGTYAIYVWNARSSLTASPRLGEAFSLIRIAEQYDLHAENLALTRAFFRREARLAEVDITATLIWVGMYQGRLSGTIDKGYEDGVQRGTELLIVHDRRFRGAMEITSVSPSSASGTLHTLFDVPRPVVGDQVSTVPPDVP